MSIFRWTIGVALLAWCAVPAMAQSSIQTAFNCDLGNCGEPSCGCDDPTCCCEEPSCGCETECSDSCCSLGCGCDWCCLGDAWTLKDKLCPCSPIDVGGWVQIGYHTDPVRLSRFYGEGLSFNDVPDQLNLHQAWLYFEKEAEADACSADWGFRFDIVYGTDAQKTQAFGNDGGTWDVTFDHGVYGWALPQLYGEVAFGDWSVIAGHFYTLVGYEVVTAPDNFFYSRALTQFNSEPFTHTGVLATYSGMDDITAYAGWTLGWDTGFDQAGGGSNFLGGLGVELADDVTVTYITTAGDFGWRGEGYSHSVVVDVALSDSLNYVLQSDYVNADVPGFDNEDVGINQYVLYSVNDCLGLGARLEWWKSNAVVGEAVSFHEITFGVNYKPHANVVIRPEIRYDWTPAADLVNGVAGVPYDETTFGVDAIFTF